MDRRALVPEREVPALALVVGHERIDAGHRWIMVDVASSSGSLAASVNSATTSEKSITERLRRENSSIVNPSHVPFLALPQGLPSCGRPCSWRMRVSLDAKQQ